MQVVAVVVGSKLDTLETIKCIYTWAAADGGAGTTATPPRANGSCTPPSCHCRYQMWLWPFLREDKDSCILHSQCHVCRWPGDARSQGISSNGSVLVSWNIPVSARKGLKDGNIYLPCTLLCRYNMVIFPQQLIPHPMAKWRWYKMYFVSSPSLEHCK